MNDITNNVNGRKEKLRFLSFPQGTILAGALLILSSLLPQRDLTSHSRWTEEDAENFALLSEEFHRFAHQSPETVKQMNIRNGELKDSFEAMHEKLEHARSRPDRWSQYLLWSGALLTGLGGLSHLTARK